MTTQRCEFGSDDCIGVADTVVVRKSDKSELQICLKCWYHDQDHGAKLRARGESENLTFRRSSGHPNHRHDFAVNRP